MHGWAIISDGCCNYVITAFPSHVMNLLASLLACSPVTSRRNGGLRSVSSEKRSLAARKRRSC